MHVLGTGNESGKGKGSWLEGWAPAPVFFVSVASKGVRFPVKPLESTLMGILISVADKGLRGIGRDVRLEGLQV
jgi:hypothetical protein